MNMHVSNIYVEVKHGVPVALYVCAYKRGFDIWLHVNCNIEKDTHDLELSSKLCIDYATMRPSGDTGLRLRKGFLRIIFIKTAKENGTLFLSKQIDLILRLHKLLGNRWSMIAGRIPGRTGNDVKNYWNTYIRSRSNKQNSEPKEDTTPHDIAFDIYSGLISSPMVSDDMIKEYLDELHDDAEIGWSLDDHAMKGRVLDVEQKVGESSLFELPIEETTSDQADMDLV
nr:hypothetical protein [Tanacetum cinerariifolium]